MNKIFNQMWMDWFCESIKECHEELLNHLEYKFNIEERLPDEDNINFVFSIFGS